MLWTIMALACAAETSVTPPSIGSVRDCDGRLRRVFGTPGAFVLGPPAAEGPAAEQRKGPVRAARVQGRTLILVRADGSEKQLQLPGPAATLQRIDKDWLAAVPFAIRLKDGDATVYRLPMKACAAHAEVQP
jgi:hypothetical protein